MDGKSKALEFKVGLFVFTGLAVIAAMVVWFGRLGQGFKQYYPLQVEFPDAGGLIRNSDVRLAGARVGFVGTNPIITRSVNSVRLELRIDEQIRIPLKTVFRVGSSGLLGDRFVEIVPAPDFDAAAFNPDDPGQFYQPGALVQGEKASGIDELARKGTVVLDKLVGEIDAVRELTDRVNTGVLSAANVDNLAGTLASFKQTSDRLAASAEAVNRLVTRGQTVIDSINSTAQTTGEAAADLRQALTDARALIKTTQGTIEQFKPAAGGPVAALLRDQQLTDDLRALVRNLRERGVLFYKDAAAAGPDRPSSRGSGSSRSSSRDRREP